MDESMATTPALPMKRPYEEVASDSCSDIAPGSCSGSESESDSDSDAEERALRKARMEPGSDVPEFTTYSEFVEYCGGRSRANQFILDRYQEQVTRRCKLKEIWYFLKSKGLVDRAESVKSEEDLDEEELREFKGKQWYLNDRLGPYDHDYQRLVVQHDSLSMQRWNNSYGNCFRSYDCDIAYEKFFEELKELVEQAASSSNAESIGQSISAKYEKLDSASVRHATRQVIDWWYVEVFKKDAMPRISKICHEVLIKERDYEEVVNEIVRQVTGPRTRGEVHILADIDQGYGFTINLINHVKRDITENMKDKIVDENMIECLVKRYMEENPEYLFYYFKYVDYIKMKLPVAKNLGII